MSAWGMRRLSRGLRFRPRRIGKVHQGGANRPQQFRRIDDGDGVDPGVVQFRVTVREDIAKSDDVAGVRNCLGHGGRNFGELAHGLAADFQGAFDGGSGFVVGKVLIETVSSNETHHRRSVALDAFQIDARITRRRRSGTCPARCNSAGGGCGWCALRSGPPAVKRALPALP